MKRKYLIFVIIFTIICISGCAIKSHGSDSKKFKKEYESLNNMINKSGNNYRTVKIDSNNPFIYADGEDIVKMIEDKKTFYVYFGSSYCPWCRSVVEKAIEIANKNKIDTIYYVDIWDGAHNEIFRDKYKLDDNGNLEMVFEGGKGYKELLKYFDKLLDDYTLTDDNGNSIPVGEKRIFAPNYIYVEKGKAIKLVSGISGKQKNSNDKLTDEILKDEENQFVNLFKK